MSPSSIAPAGPLDAVQVSDYHRDGYLLLGPGLLPSPVFEQVNSAIPEILGHRGPRTVFERDGHTVRSVYGPHQFDPSVAALARHPNLVGAARQLLSDEVYIHQSKINVKAGLSGDQWEWHQDYINWLRCDGIQKPDLVNVAVFLNEVTEFNGPLMFIPGTHREGLMSGTDRENMPVGYEEAPSWVATLTADEKFRIDPAVIKARAHSNGLVSAKGAAGSVLLFHSSVLHASLPNISPFDRAVLIMVFNGIGNPPGDVAAPRPEFLASREVVALQPATAAN